MPCYDHPDLNAVDIITVLRALADPVRLELVRRLNALGGANCATLVGDRPKSTMSHHFQVLRDSGIVHTQICGVQHHNTLRRAELDARYPGLMAAILATT